MSFSTYLYCFRCEAPRIAQKLHWIDFVQIFTKPVVKARIDMNMHEQLFLINLFKSQLLLLYSSSRKLSFFPKVVL